MCAFRFQVYGNKAIRPILEKHLAGWPESFEILIENDASFGDPAEDKFAALNAGIIGWSLSHQ